ncbi:MAG: AAA domain-containing protein [Bacilli bacterium]
MYIRRSGGTNKKKRKGYQFSGFSGKPDEKLVISTADDFQGDERDIIIVSMVRNPSGARYDAEFIKNSSVSTLRCQERENF